jgi:hypothetical protein
MSRFLPLGALALLTLPLVSACGNDVCDDPAGALAAAVDGETVSMGSCRATGNVTVPAGVIFRGEPGSVLAGRVTLEPGSSLSGITIEAGGVVASGSEGSVTIDNVTVEMETGVAVRIEGIGADLSGVTLRGTVTADNATDVPPMPVGDEWPTHGLLLVDAGSAESPVELNDVEVSGFARFGALFRNSHVEWRGGGASENLTVGAMAERGSITVEGASFERNYQGVQPFPAFGAVFTDGVEVATTDVQVSENEGYGLLHDDATVGHVDLVATNNGDAAVWVQAGRSFMLAGESSMLAGNLLAGVVLVETPDAMIQDATIDTSSLATRIDGETGMVQVGDGVHAVVGSASGLIFDGLTMTGNERAGMLLDVADGSVDGAVMDVTVDGSGESLGVIAQGPAGVIPSGTWDENVTRLGATVANDAALDEALDIVGLIGPMFVPPPTM